MRRYVEIILGLALLSMTLAPAVASDEANPNERFVDEHLGDAYDPDAIIPVEVNGEVHPMRAEEAVELFLDTTERVDLFAISQAADEDPPAAEAGDLLLHAIFGECGETTTILETPVPTLELDPQLWIYGGGLIQGVASEDTSYVNHLAKTEGSAAGTAFIGHGTSLCIPLIGWPGDIWLVVIDGAIHDPSLAPPVP